MSVLQIFRGDDFLEEVVLSRAVMGLGRHPQNDIVLDDRSLSRFHARVERRGDRFVVVDCGAQNGVHLNGERVVGESDLAPGDRITLGRYIAVFDTNQRAATPPRHDVAKPSSKNGKNGHNGHNGHGENGKNGHNGNGANGHGKPTFDEEIAALEIDDINIDVEPPDQTKKAKHKELAGKDGARDKNSKVEPTLVLLFNGMEVSRHPVPSAGLTIGRSKQSDVVISLLGLSRKHAKLTVQKDKSITVEDLGSQNGTWVNNQRIAGQRKLKHGDLLNFYDYAVLFLEDGEVDVGFPGPMFSPPGDSQTGGDDLSQRETNRSGPAPAAARRPPTARSLVPMADSGHSNKPVHGNHNAMNSASELVDLGEGSFLGDEFEEEARAKKGESDLSPSLMDEAALDAEEELDDVLIPGIGDKTNATDVVEDVALKDELKGLEIDDSGGFDGVSGTEGEQQRFEDKTSSNVSSTHAWPSDKDLLKALSNTPDTIMATIEVTQGGKPYTQMPLSQTVTRVGTDARCELSLPKTSGLLPWHLTLLHVGGAVVLYRSAKAGRIVLAETEVDMAILKDGDMLDLGKVRLKLRIK